MKVTRKIIEINDDLCDGCGQCVPSCAEGALQIVDGKAKLVAEVYCDGLGACLGECPNDALRVMERDADEFDEHAVEKHLSSMEKEEGLPVIPIMSGCPSGQIKTFTRSGPHQEASGPPTRVVGPPTRVVGPPTDVVGPAVEGQSESALTHWPVQIRLVPPTAPFLKGANLLVVADCVPVAYPNFHKDFLKGKVVMVGCPKFDDVPGYIQKFADIFKMADIRSVSVLVMEVPCCQGLPIILERGMEKAGKKIPMEKVVISARGDVLGREKMAA
jgi:Pyruvate/2-oxoacid:ferredoxin oxidoreductase delta subunit